MIKENNVKRKYTKRNKKVVAGEGLTLELDALSYKKIMEVVDFKLRKYQKDLVELDIQMDKRVFYIEYYLSLPWYKRIFTKYDINPKSESTN